MRARLLAAAMVGVAGVTLMPVTALAHALPQQEVPSEGSEVQQAPAEVEILFGEQPDPSLSTITVVNSQGSSVTSGSTTPVPGDPSELEVPLQRNLPSGVYTVTWKTVSAVDGHLASGSYAFGVRVSAAAANRHAETSVVSPPPSPLTIAMRLVFYAGAMLLLGVAAMCIAALREVPRFARRLLAIAAALTVIGTLGIIEAQRESTGISLGTLLSTSLGTQALWRVVSGAIACVSAVVALRLSSRNTRIALGVTALAAIADMYVDVAYSHAGAQAPVWLNLIAQLVHIGAAGVWIGGLVVLVIALRVAATEERGGIAKRFSFVFGFCIAMVAITGTFRAVIEVGSFAALVSTSFGVLVLVKVGLFLVLAALGATNRWVHVPQAPRLVHRLRRFASTEVVVGVAVVAVAAALVNVAPPLSGGLTAQASTQPQQIVVTGSDFATTVKLKLVIAPGVAGFNTFTADVDDYDSGNPLNASSVVLTFTSPLRAGVAQSTLILQRQSTGVFSARGANISLDGVWSVNAVINNGLQSTEVTNLLLFTDETPPQVTVTNFGGNIGTTYTVQLSGGRTLQVYLESEPGFDEFHMTFFAASGNEIPTSSVVVGETPLPSGPPTVLAARRLDPVGHWVADAHTLSGRTRFDVIATLPGGAVLATYVIITPGS